jgi:hypothetical protein
MCKASTPYSIVSRGTRSGASRACVCHGTLLPFTRHSAATYLLLHKKSCWHQTHNPTQEKVQDLD